jgi:hypothetical protein
MKAKLLTLVMTAAMLVGGLAWTNTADARPWRGYYAGPAARFYRGGYAYPYRYYAPYRNYDWYGPRYFGPRYYAPGYFPGYRYPGYYRSGIYLGAGPVGVLTR